MKNVLNYQTTEYDCGTTCLINALRYLYERRDIHPELLKTIALSTLDTYNAQGETGKRGTTKAAIRYLADWFTEYGQWRNFPISAKFLDGEAARLTPESEMADCLRQGGAVMIRCLLGGDGHYVLLTRLMGEEVGLFDPYDSRCEPQEEQDAFFGDVKLVDDQPRAMNRIVGMDTINATTEENYNMGPWKDREVMLIYGKMKKASTP